MRIYLIGIKGSGMASLAILLKEDLYEVRGADVARYIYTEDELRRHHINIDSFSEMIIDDHTLVIVGHDFIDKYREQLINDGIPYLEYHDFINFYFNKHHLIAICGSHGKTTLTGMIAKATGEATYLIGDGEAHKEKAEKYCFFEACEYKDHFLNYHPSFIIVTNIDYDHVDYFKTREQYLQSFKSFCDKANCGLIEYKASKEIRNPYFFSYGIDSNADFHVKNYCVNQQGIKGDLFFQSSYITSFSFDNLFGLPLLYDVIAVLAFYSLKNENLEKIKKAISNFEMVRKRYNIFKVNGNILIDDYAHHPTQIKTNYDTIKRTYPLLKKVAIFKPDRQSRFEYFENDFFEALHLFDQAFILDYPHQKLSFEPKYEDEKVHYLSDENNIKSYLLKNQKYIIIFMSSKNMNGIRKIVSDYLQ